MCFLVKQLHITFKIQYDDLLCQKHFTYPDISIGKWVLYNLLMLLVLPLVDGPEIHN